MRRKLGLVIVALLSGCTTTPRINQFKSFAELGHKHQAALTAIIDQATSSNIDANSQEILDVRTLAVISKHFPKDKAGGDQAGEDILRAQNDAVVETTRQYAAIKRHAALLDDYFQKLGALASYDSAPIAASTTATVTALQKVSPTLAALKVGDTTFPAAVGAIAPVVITGIKGQLLEKELRTYGDIINNELALQERVLIFVAARIASDQTLLAQTKIMDKLAVPFADLSKPTVPAEWLTNRRDLLLAQAVAAEPAAEAAKLSGQLRQAFLVLLAGKLTPDDVSSLASDMTHLITLIDVVTTKPAGASQ